MYARRQTRPKPRKSEPRKWLAPVAGWIANRALSDPSSIEGPGAAVLDNFFPKSTSVSLRRGKARYATLEDTELPVTALFAYRNGANEKLFGANENVIYDLTNVEFPFDALLVTEDGDELVTESGDVFGWLSTDGLDVMTGYTGGEWITAQFATTGGVYLIGVNGVDTGFIFDGTDFFPYVSGGVWRLDYDNESTAFTAGDTVTGGTSGATGTIWKVVDGGSGAGYLLLTDITGGPFQNDEALTDGSGGSADADGAEALAAPGPTFSGVDTSDMAYVWVYKNRLFFAEKDSMNAWYMIDVDAVGGNADVFPLAGVFTQGGSLLFGSAWSLDSSGDSGLSDQCVFVSTLGQVAVYRGDDPSGDPGIWAKAGLYRIGAPLGRRAFLRGGGDLAIATNVGLVPLSKAISLDITALNVATVSYKIADEWSNAISLRGASEWQCIIWPEEKMAIISPPDLVGSSEPVLFVSNTETGAWARFTGWHALCLEVFQGRLYFGSPQGAVFIANVGGEDDGETYSGAVVPLFDDMGTSPSLKVATVGRARVRANTSITDQVAIKADFDTSLPPPPDATPFPAVNVWDAGIWDTSIWGETTPSVINQQWRSVSGIGYSLAPCYQVTSGSVAPLDAELIDMETLHTTSEAVT